ncbi:YSIRK-type signal peptide-containing protein [Staphylococcus haemolyticus]|uniref:YSIRK-type signal peptide-containing protein n=1 Tax=Staphylococcus haemolyticus TaxID=1283 RepID=UPI001374AAA5|nr:YSIRK-type signal peptide-containing protein [Staphylococcus haemolyticus]QUX19764.1 YSIRK-type signal peptide-containing protein [Staphylococcus haemolyticus]
MKNKQNKRLYFIPNKQNKYSIRKFTVGTASILVGAALIFGSANDEAKAAEKDQVSTTTNSNEEQIKVMYKHQRALHYHRLIRNKLM